MLSHNKPKLLRKFQEAAGSVSLRIATIEYHCTVCTPIPPPNRNTANLLGPGVSNTDRMFRIYFEAIQPFHGNGGLRVATVLDDSHGTAVFGSELEFPELSTEPT